MKIEEIEEGNKLIGIFDGWFTDPNVNKGSDINYFHHERSTKLTDTLYIPSRPSNFKYNTSWNWLIPVIDKIYDLDEYYTYKCEKESPFSDGGIDINTKFIMDTWESVVEFIKWYNKLHS